MTSPASGAGSAADLPDSAPIARPAQSATAGAASPGGSPRRGLALLVIATAQLMVVLDATIVNVALPHVQSALGFSGSGLEWVVNAYAVTFGGLLLLGGRAGDRLGRRRVFVFGLLLFSAASLFGGFATSQAWLLTARAIQGVGGAIIAPTALALITTNFPEGQERNRAFGVYAAMSGGGSAAGLLLGGILTTYLSWRWVFFVNVPIGILVAFAAPRVLSESPRRPGRIDVAGAVTATLGIALLVFGLSKAATGADGISHWGDAQVVASLTASVVLLVSFALIEVRSSHPLLPMRVLADRNRAGAYLIMLCIATGLFGLFFFLTLFIQTVLGYTAIHSGIAYLPFAVGVVIASALASQLVPRVGARPLILAGAALVAGGMFWFSRLTEHAGYASDLLGPQLVSSFGLGLVFVPLSLVALHNVAEQDSGVASSLLNTGQQVGGAIGLALLGTVAWTTVADSVRTQFAAAARAGLPVPKPGAPLPVSIYHHALAVGFSRGFLVASGIALLALLIGIVTIRITRGELAGAGPEPHEAAPPQSAAVPAQSAGVPAQSAGVPARRAAAQPAAPESGTAQRQQDRAARAAAARPCRFC
ncbi:MFS transporter [Trebonia kvetii]|uniref:MFS transporter n=1 Tax=Trebonia kvetii TaxID=2480626 RepID=UPI001C9E6A83|nr:MFS transporter [Trebonia kvetii]